MKETNAKFCPQCGQPLAAGSAFCEQCGSRIDPLPTPLHGEPSETEEPRSEPPPSAAEEASQQPPVKRKRRTEKAADDFLMAWEISVPMVNNPFFLWDMAKLWGLSCFLLFLVMMAIWVFERSESTLHFALIVPTAAFVAFFVLSLIIALVFFFNRFYSHTILRHDGVEYELARWSSKLSKAVAGGNLILGALTSSPQALAAGVVGEMQRSVKLPWRDIKKVSFFPGFRAITLSNSWRPVLRLRFESDELYAQAREIIRREVEAAGGSLTRK